jgi:hypothetical protein
MMEVVVAREFRGYAEIGKASGMSFNAGRCASKVTSGPQKCRKGRNRTIDAVRAAEHPTGAGLNQTLSDWHGRQVDDRYPARVIAF